MRHSNNDKKITLFKIFAGVLLSILLIQSFAIITILKKAETSVEKLGKDVEKNNHKIAAGFVFEQSEPIANLSSYKLSGKLTLPPNVFLSDLKYLKIKNSKGPLSLMPYDSNFTDIKDNDSIHLRIASPNLEAYVIDSNNLKIIVKEPLCYTKIPQVAENQSNSRKDSNGLVLTLSDKYKTRIPIANSSTNNGNLRWGMVICENSLSKTTLGLLSNRLKEKGYFISDNNEWKDIKGSIYEFQKDNKLPIGYLDFETLEKLGIKILIKQKDLK